MDSLASLYCTHNAKSHFDAFIANMLKSCKSEPGIEELGHLKSADDTDDIPISDKNSAAENLDQTAQISQPA